MAGDPEGLVTFDAGGKRYTAVFGFKAMKAVETHYDLPFFQALQSAMPTLAPEDASDKAKVMAAGASIRMSAVSKLFEAALMKHHPGLTEDDVDNLVDEIGFKATGDIISRSVAAAIVEPEGDGKSPANPRRRTGKRTG